MGGGSVADGARHMVVLLADANAGADSIPIALGSDQFQDNPIILARAHVLPQLCGVLKRRDHNVDFAVVVKICEGTAAVRPGNLEIIANRCGTFPESPVSEVREMPVAWRLGGRSKRCAMVFGWDVRG